MAPWTFFVRYLLYWAVSALLFCAVTARQKYNAFDKPMRLLGDAAKRVSSGDFSVSLQPLHPAKRQSYVDVMFTDFNKMVEELGSMETMKKDFVSNVSHEFKTPLATVQNYAAALRAGGLDAATQASYLDTIVASANDLSALVTNILRLSKVENQVIPPTCAPYDLCRQLADCMIAFEDKLDAKRLELDADMEDERTVCADASMLELVWNNLLSNAVKFSEPGGVVAVRETSDGDAVTVTVSDGGCGMDGATQARIFDKFYQGDTSHSREGNGLGLPLARRVVELFGGSISVESAPGKGAAFTVVVPLKER